MDEFKKFLKDNPSLAIVLPACLSVIQFIAEIAYTVQDTVGFKEFKDLVTAGSGLEAGFLVFVMIMMRNE